MFNKYTREEHEEALKPAAETGTAAAAAGWTSDLIPFMDGKGGQKQMPSYKTKSGLQMQPNFIYLDKTCIYPQYWTFLMKKS